MLPENVAEADGLTFCVVKPNFALNSQAIQLDPGLPSQLLETGYVVLTSDSIFVPEAFCPAFVRLKQRYDHLQQQPMEMENVPAYFRERCAEVHNHELGPGDCEAVLPEDDFALNLVRAVVKVLPGYDRTKTYPVSWMLTRHRRSVPAMPLHRDHVGWLVQFNISRTSGVQGGSIIVANSRGGVVEAKVLVLPLEGYILYDQEFLHGTTALQMGRELEDHRDVIIIRIPLLTDISSA
jgi:hypothetical protein